MIGGFVVVVVLSCVIVSGVSSVISLIGWVVLLRSSSMIWIYFCVVSVFSSCMYGCIHMEAAWCLFIMGMYPNLLSFVMLSLFASGVNLWGVPGYVLYGCVWLVDVMLKCLAIILI